MTSVLPSLFVSHGSPTLAIEDGEARRFLTGLGETIGRPAAILVVSAHYDEPVASITNGAAPSTIYDFGDFARELKSLTYPAPGDPALAERVAGLLAGAGIEVYRDQERGFDHGTWVPLILMYPKADVPVVQLSIDSRKGPDYHLALGRALAPLRGEGVLIVGSGAVTHNLRELFGDALDHDRRAPDWVVDFADWVSERVEQGLVDDLLAYRALSPSGERNHPTEEHLLPLFAALGAGEARGGRRIHASQTYGLLAMDVYSFGAAA